MKLLYFLLAFFAILFTGYLFWNDFSFDNITFSNFLITGLFITLSISLLIGAVIYIIKWRKNSETAGREMMTIREYYQYKSAR